jgi:hypothetical protein
MAPRTPAKKTNRTASGGTSRQARKTPTTTAEAVAVDVDEVVGFSDLPMMEEVSFAALDNGPEARVDEERQGMVTADGKALKTETVVFRGRAMVVKVPDEVQIAIMKRFGSRYGSMQGSQKISASRAITMSDRAISIIQSVLSDESDQEWIEDALLRKEFGIEDALTIIHEAMEKLKIANAPNREELRKATKSARLVTEE